MNVLSVFDGMSCGQIALERAGIKVENYFASEIDKYAIQVARKNYPNTIPLGSVEDWRSWALPKIDLLIGGSPCQGFSNAGLGLNFQDPRSKLFFTYVDILKDLKEKNPDLQFLLENVKMKKEWQKIISDLLGVEPVKINSALVSAQNRERLYWANWKIEQPEDKGIFLKDIIEENVDESHFLSEKAISYITNAARIKKKFTAVDGDKSLAVMANYNNSKNGTFVCVDCNGREDEKKTGTLTASYAKGVEANGSRPFIRLKEKSNAVRSGGRGSGAGNKHEWDNVYQSEKRLMVKTIGHGYVKEKIEEADKYPSLCAQSPRSKHMIQVGVSSEEGYELTRRVYSPEGKSPTLLGRKSGGGYEPPKISTDEPPYIEHTNFSKRKTKHYDKTVALRANASSNYQTVNSYRKLTVLECERLQTVPEGYTEGVSNTQRYKMLGNGWTVDAIVWILNSNPNLM